MRSVMQWGGRGANQSAHVGPHRLWLPCGRNHWGLPLLAFQEVYGHPISINNFSFVLVEHNLWGEKTGFKSQSHHWLVLQSWASY